MPNFFQRAAWLPFRLFAFVFCRLKLIGTENLKDIKGNAIIASNHITEIDPFIMVIPLPFWSRLLPLTYVTMDKDFYANNPRGFLYGGVFFRMLGGKPAYPGLKDYGKSLKNHLEVLNQGKTVCIYPVGRKHSFKEIDQARGGVSYLALKTGLPIVPIKLDGIANHKLLDYFTFKCKWTITVGKPLYAKDIFGKTMNDSHPACEKAAVKLMQYIKQLP